MTAPPGGPAMTGAPPAAGRAGRIAEVSWFDIRAVTMGPADLAELDPRETARAAAFVFPADRHRYQVAHVMLRRVLAGHLGTDPGRLTFARQPCPACGRATGRPVLALPSRGDDPPGTPRGADGARPARRQAPARTPSRGDAPLSFSLAHSGDTVAIAVARAPVGIDVERRATGCVCSLASAMHPADAALVDALPEPDRHLAVIRWWVRAEAVLKCAGTGIAHGMDSFAVLGTPSRGQVLPGPRLPWEPDATGWAAAGGCSFAALSAPKGYQAALALPGLRMIRYRGGPDGR